MGELVETAEQHRLEEPLPYFVAVFAASSCIILANPLHPMYTKINKFLHKGPEWQVDKMPSYWADRILLHPPIEDDGYCLEVEWFLDFLISGLRTPKVYRPIFFTTLSILNGSQDMEIYRRASIFERLLTFSTSVSLQKPLLKKLSHLLYRCTYVEGSTTLITRCGLLSWIEGETVRNTDEAAKLLLDSLAKRAYEMCDRSKVDPWIGGAGVKLIGI